MERFKALPINVVANEVAMATHKIALWFFVTG
jgi:hypothetical protein